MELDRNPDKKRMAEACRLLDHINAMEILRRDGKNEAEYQIHKSEAIIIQMQWKTSTGGNK